MAKTNIPGTRTDWKVIRGQLNSMFNELYPIRAQITDQGTQITFNPSIPINTEFEVILISCMYLGQSVGVGFSNITRLGMTATSAEPNATLIYQILTF